MGDYTSILFAPPSIAEGVARVLDLGDTLTEFNRSLSPEAADLAALRSDWSAVGRDLSAAFEHVAKERSELPERK